MIQAYPLSEGTFTIGHDKIFVPFDETKDVLNQRPIGSLLVEIQPFLIDNGTDLMILDTGLGFKNEQGVLQIHQNIHDLGYSPDDVTKVLFSHLHKDHISGAVYKNENGVFMATFPNAEYCIYRPEAQYALATGAPSYETHYVEEVLKLENIRWLDGQMGDIDGLVHYTHSGGHCPQHIVYLIESSNQRFFFGGDEAPQYKQIKTKYIAKYDYDGKRAMELRNLYAQEGKMHDWNFLFYHDVKKPISKIDF